MNYTVQAGMNPQKTAIELELSGDGQRVSIHPYTGINKFIDINQQDIAEVRLLIDLITNGLDHALAEHAKLK